MSNVCEGGVDPRQSPVRLQCPLLPPRGLQVSIRGEAVAVRPGEDVLFVVRQEQVRGRFGRAHRAVGGVLSPSESWGAESSEPAFSKLREVTVPWRPLPRSKPALKQ